MKKFETDDIEDLLMLLIEAADSDTLADRDVEDIEVQTFKGAGVLTPDKGIVFHVNGREFQISIVRSK